MRKKRKLDKDYKMHEIKNSRAMNEDYKKALSFIVVLVVIIALLALLFYLNGRFVSKDIFQGDQTTTTTEPAYNEKNILIDNIFTIKDKEYMVMLYDTSDDVESITFSSAVNYYQSDDIKLYTADLANGMNKMYYNKDGKENTKPTKASEIVVTRPTLMVIKNGKVTNYITDSKEILKKLTPKED